MTGMHQPTENDRKAATLFAAAPGMRALVIDGHSDAPWWGVVASASSGLVRVADALYNVMALAVHAFDMDDAATKGAAMGQLRTAAPGFGTGVLHLRPLPTSDNPGRFAVFSCGMPQWFGDTEGAALVAAMEALQK